MCLQKQRLQSIWWGAQVANPVCNNATARILPRIAIDNKASSGSVGGTGPSSPLDPSSSAAAPNAAFKLSVPTATCTNTADAYD